MNSGTLISTGARPVIRFERQLPASIEDVWRKVTDPTEMRTWFPTRIEIDEWKVSAKLTHHFDGHDIDPLPGTVLEWQPPRRARLTWGDDTITFELTPTPEGGTVFALSEELSAAHAARNAAGWENCLDRLQFDREIQSWKSRFDEYTASFEPVLGRQEGPPQEFNVSQS